VVITIGLVVPVILIVGGIIAAVVGNQFLHQLTEPADVGIFAGTVIHLVGLATALVTGIASVGQLRR
jgi:putative effector of murein hydrolase